MSRITPRMLRIHGRAVLTRTGYRYSARVRPAVSAVIPTILRPDVVEAIRSAREQVGTESVEVVVSVDRDRDDCSAEELRRISDADTVVFTGGGRRGGYARNRGVAAASGEWVAFLDDDDLWLPQKTAVEVAAARAS